MILSNAAETVFLAATVPVLLRVIHDRDGRPAGRTDSDDGNRGKATFGCVSPKNAIHCTISAQRVQSFHSRDTMQFQFTVHHVECDS